MGFLSALSISASGLTAERLRMDVIANNLANANTTRTAEGGPYKRQEVVLSQRGASAGIGGVELGSAGLPVGEAGGVVVDGIVADTTAPRMAYDPGHPDANAQGYVAMPNVNPVTEMTDLITATRAYEANVTAIQAIKNQAQRTLDVLR
jgi:flagellar basal-body rod protein FlgC